MELWEAIESVEQLLTDSLYALSKWSELGEENSPEAKQASADYDAAVRALRALGCSDVHVNDVQEQARRVVHRRMGGGLQ